MIPNKTLMLLLSLIGTCQLHAAAVDEADLVEIEGHCYILPMGGEYPFKNPKKITKHFINAKVHAWLCTLFRWDLDEKRVRLNEGSAIPVVSVCEYFALCRDKQESNKIYAIQIKGKNGYFGIRCLPEEECDMKSEITSIAALTGNKPRVCVNGCYLRRPSFPSL